LIRKQNDKRRFCHKRARQHSVASGVPAWRELITEPVVLIQGGACSLGLSIFYFGFSVSVMMTSAYQAQFRLSLSSCSASRLFTSIRAAWIPSNIHGNYPRTHC